MVQSFLMREVVREVTTTTTRRRGLDDGVQALLLAENQPKHF